MEPVQIARLEEMRTTYEDLMGQLGTPEVAADHERYTELAKQASEVEEAVKTYEDYREAADEASEARELLGADGSADEREFYRTTLADAESRMQRLASRLETLLLPRDPRDDSNVLVEIRAGTGGDEAGLFAGDLFRMYERFAERRGWKTEVVDVSHSDVGGFKEIVFEVRGKGAFADLKYESGVHRVQRVPATESSGRIHTSTATVAVLPEAEEVSVEVSPDELKVDTYRSSGPGGQHVNTTDSAVRLTHVPSGIVVACQSERSQRQNRERAMKLLLSKLQARAEEEAQAELAAERRSQVGMGERSEKIRTYNFPQDRITDHRIKLTVHGMDQVLDGEIEEITDSLKRHAAELALASDAS